MTGGDALAQRYAEIRARISAAAAGREVTLVAVSKTVEPERVEALYRLGQRDFGENYAQELLSKSAAVAARGLSDIRWHFIGHLQSNKAKLIVPVVRAVHAIDSAKLARELAKRWREAGRDGRLPVFIEVNIDEEPGKSGVAPVQAAILMTEVGQLRELDLRGLMCVPRARDPASEAAELRSRFAALRALLERSGAGSRGELSMGMSGDFELAIAEGATHVRVGTALFGARQP